MNKILKFFTLAILFFNSYLFSQTYFSENFETGGLGSWTTTDLNNDNTDWSIIDYGYAFQNLDFFSIYSYSHYITTDNLITSSAIDLSSVTSTNVFLIYDYYSLLEGSIGEHYAVYITTSNIPSQIINSEPIFETTINQGGHGQKYIDVSNFIGQNVYISFRHFSTSNLYLILDNIELKTLSLNDAKLVTSSIPRYALIGSSQTLQINVKNKGYNDINNVTVNWNDGTDHISSIPTFIAPGASVFLNHPIVYQYESVVEKDILITISSVNEESDVNMSDNSLNNKFNTLSQVSPKKVLFEEGTGSWCGYCPRGAVVLDQLKSNHSNETIGVAVHNEDPMTNIEYDTASNFLGFPTFHVDRVFLNKSADTEELIMFKNQRNLTPCPVSVDISGSFVNSNVTLNASALFRTSFSNANFRFGVIITEDNVTGTTEGYDQNNNYSGSSTPMGGYELLPQVIPAAQMVYNHVGRALLGGYNGQAGSIPSVITDGQVYNYTFNYTVPSTSTIEDMNAIIVVIDQFTGEVVNAKSVPLSTFSLANNELNSLDTIKIYPNPTNDFFKISNLKEGNYDVVIYDMSGKLVQSKNNISIIENESVTIPVNQLAKGVYMVNIASGKTSYSKQLLID